MRSYPLTISYKQMDMLTNVLPKCNGTILSKSFNAQVYLVLSLPVNEAENFLNRFKPYGS
jgi:putative IMPACT (imprinted ancient) family translation regulator